jgi:hypothetical protein
MAHQPLQNFQFIWQNFATVFREITFKILRNKTAKDNLSMRKIL